jgi:hypothetical protein
MKTPMQELLEEVTAELERSTDVDYRDALFFVVLAIQQVYLEKEKAVAQQYAAFAIECDRQKLPVIEFDGWIDINTNEKEGNK